MRSDEAELRNWSNAPAAKTRYVRVATALKEEIVKGAYPVGSQLPTEAELCACFSVSRHTVREALRLLRDERLIASRQGAGSVVLPPPPPDSFVLQGSSINDLLAYAKDMHTEIESTRMEVIEGKRAARIGVAGGEEWLVVTGLAKRDRQQAPVCWSDYYISREFAAVGRLLPRHSGPVFLLLEDLFGLNIVEIDQEISGSEMTPVLAAKLQVEPGSAGIEVRRTYRTAGGEIAQISVHTHPSSRFRHILKMQRARV
jgi:DNA-binding GntR family transcriptional regulator